MYDVNVNKIQLLYKASEKKIYGRVCCVIILHDFESAEVRPGDKIVDPQAGDVPKTITIKYTVFGDTPDEKGYWRDCQPLVLHDESDGVPATWTTPEEVRAFISTKTYPVSITVIDKNGTVLSPSPGTATIDEHSEIIVE